MSPRAGTTDRGVSPVLGGTLMLVVVVLLAAVLGSIAFGFQDFLVEPGPQVAFDTEYHADGEGNGANGAFVVSHEAGSVADGSEVFVRDDVGNEIAWEAV